MLLWRGIGFQGVIFLAGICALPPQFYDAAQIDGAGKFQLFVHVTLPLLKQTTVLVFVMTILWAFQMFTPIYVMSQPLGGPLDSTRVLMVHIYENAFWNFRMGYAAAMAIVMLFIVLAVSYVQLRVGRSSWEY
jgi:multiple sugar transport system permease protein/raffinose/stachyose/melibiose transport system permease protein